MNVMKPIFALLIFLLHGVFAQAETWRINTLDWPPYTCARCPENGAAAKALRDSLKTVGVDVEFVFYTWGQAIQKSSDAAVVGYFPLWRESLKSGFQLSPPLFQSPLGFIEPRNKPLAWNSLMDLRGKKLGVTKDYGNTAEFNRLVKSGVIKVEVAVSDDINVLKVAEGKLDGALMDINNARYFLFTSQAGVLSKVRVNGKILEAKDLYLAVNHKNAGKMDKIKTALKNLNFQRVVDEYLLKYQRKVD